MTTQPKEQQEPSMEEILSSIRRIIADEAGDEENEQGDAGAQAEALDRDADLSSPGVRDGDVDDEDVLELTEVVREDGEVIGIDPALVQPRFIEPETPEADPAEPDPDAETGEHAPVARAHHAHDRTSEREREPSDMPAAAERSGAAKPADDRATPSRMDIRDDAMEPQQTTTPKNNGIETLVSDQAAGAATGALAKLSQAVQRTPPELAIADESGRSVEQFVEDMMRPMLRDWLDQHLPPLVERIVQREIRKIVRRAEDD